MLAQHHCGGRAESSHPMEVNSPESGSGFAGHKDVKTPSSHPASTVSQDCAWPIHMVAKASAGSPRQLPPRNLSIRKAFEGHCKKPSVCRSESSRHEAKGGGEQTVVATLRCTWTTHLHGCPVRFQNVRHRSDRREKCRPYVPAEAEAHCALCGDSNDRSQQRPQSSEPLLGHAVWAASHRARKQRGPG